MDFEQALTLHRQGLTDEAGHAYERILLADPRNAGALVQLGAVRITQDRAAEAEGLLRQALAVAPDSAEAHASLAAALQRQARLEEAIAEYQRALELDPAMADARFALAVCLQSRGRSEAAISCYETVLFAEPSHAEANYGLGLLRAQLGQSREAIRRFRAAVSADPDFAEAHCELGKLLVSRNRLEDALESLHRALAIDPDYADARLALAGALTQLSRNDEAMAEFRVVLAAEPDNPAAQRGIDELTQGQRCRAERTGSGESASAAAEDDVEAQIAVVRAMCKRYQHDEALALARRLAARRPASADFASLLADVLAQTGAMDEAVTEHRRAFALAPDQLENAFQLTAFTKVRPGDEVLQRLEAMLPGSASLSPSDRCRLHFALAKSYTDLGEPERGFGHLLHGNAVYRSQIEYDEAEALGQMDHVARVIDAELLATRRGLGDPSTVPVFIVGMPRSGTTLVEQILASHSGVFGAGELTILREMVERTAAAQFGGGRFPEILWTMSDAELRQLGRNYAGELRKLAPDAQRITDKLPSNFVFAGLIHLILPNARIIHVQRDPVDTCLSCFSALFVGWQPFAFDLAELGRFHRAYQRLMAHWRTVLPSGAMLEVEYEALVQDFEAQARRIVAWCGLEWEAACLEFHKTSRPVATASVQQVRQPIYRSSVGRWRPDPEVLRPLLDALDGR